MIRISIGFLLALLLFSGHALPQSVDSARKKVLDIKRLYDAGQWNDVVRAVPQSSSQPADLQLYRGLALAHLQRFQEAERAFRAGRECHPRDVRFLDELAGIAYREQRFSSAKDELRRALSIDPNDDYANDFLASIYYLEGNLEAALLYWNRVDKPKLSDLIYAPVPKLDPLLLDRAFLFSPGNVWQRDRFLAARTELDSLQLFPHTFYDLQARSNGSFRMVWRNTERSSWLGRKLSGLIFPLRGLPYQSIYPEFYNLNNKALNWLSFLRWDDEKRRVSSEIATPIAENPKERIRFSFDGRNENWNISRTLAPERASFAYLNLRRVETGVEVSSIVNWRWQWVLGAEYSYRDFRTLTGIPRQAVPFFSNSSGIELHSTVRRSLIRFPERRFFFDGSAAGEAGDFFSNRLGKYARVEGSLTAKWLPQASGEDYETLTKLRAGGTLGQVPFDRLFMLGFDRDHDLWMRGYNGLRNGQKGNAPLGRNFLLSNSDIEKVVYDGAIFLVKAGPFLDTGDIWDQSRFFGSPKWLSDTGLQATVKVLGSFEFVLGYGKDLRSGTNTFYSTVSR